MTAAIPSPSCLRAPVCFLFFFFRFHIFGAGLISDLVGEQFEEIYLLFLVYFVPEVASFLLFSLNEYMKTRPSFCSQMVKSQLLRDFIFIVFEAQKLIVMYFW